MMLNGIVHSTSIIIKKIIKNSKPMQKLNNIVVKVGTSVVTRKSTLEGEPDVLDLNVMGDLVRQICRVVAEKQRRVILVSSGAVAAGKGRISLPAGTDRIVAKQSYAFVGQQRLTAAYDALFSEAQPALIPGQGLLTNNNFNNQIERQRMIGVLDTLPINVVPILNENDFIATEELTFGDNDQLAANMAQFVRAEMLILLTDVDGVFDKNPSENADAQLIKTISADRITSQFIQSCGLGKSENGTGGMASKLQAAQKAAKNGVPTFIANGKTGRNLLRVTNGEEVGTKIIQTT